MRQSRHLGMMPPLKQWFHKMPRQVYGADDSGTIKPIHINGDGSIKIYDSTSEQDDNWGTIVIGFHGGAAIPIKLNDLSPKLKFGNSIKFSLYTMWAGNHGGTDDCTNSFFCAVVKSLNGSITDVDNVIFGKQPLHTIVTVNNKTVGAHMFKAKEPGQSASGTDNVYIGTSPKVSQLNDSAIARLKKIRNFFFSKKEKTKFFSAKNGTIYLLVWGEPYGRENYHLRPTKYKRTKRVQNEDGTYTYTQYPGYVSIDLEGKASGAQVSVGYLATRPFYKDDELEKIVTESYTPTPVSTKIYTNEKTINLNQTRSYNMNNKEWEVTTTPVLIGITNSGYGAIGIPFKFDDNNKFINSTELIIQFSNISNINFVNNISDFDDENNPDDLTKNPARFYVAISTSDTLNNNNLSNHYINGNIYNNDIGFNDDDCIEQADSNLDTGAIMDRIVTLTPELENTKTITISSQDIMLNTQYYLYIFTTATKLNIINNFTVNGNIQLTLTYEGYN